MIAAILTYVVGFFATAGAAGVDFGLNSRDKRDVSMGGLVGIALAIHRDGRAFDAHRRRRLRLAGDERQGRGPGSGKEGLHPRLLQPDPGGPGRRATPNGSCSCWPWRRSLPACFSAFIAANSFKTTLPKVNPFISVGIGAAVSIILAVTGYVGKAIAGLRRHRRLVRPDLRRDDGRLPAPKGKWSGPRAGFNPAGWISWALGFVVGILPNLGFNVPAAPVLAFVVGAVVYFLCAKIGLQSAIIALPGLVPPQAGPKA